MANHSEFVHDSLLTWKAGKVASVIGPPGCGKSWQVGDLHRMYWGARAEEMPFETVMISLCDPTDLVGVLTVNEKTGETVRVPPGWVKRIVAAGGGTVFFDEATLGTPATWTVLLRVLLDKVAGDVKLPDAVRFILASNPVEMTNAGNLFPPAGANRVTHFTTGAPSPRDWGDWLQTYMAETGDEHSRKAATLIAAFVQRRGDRFLFDMPKGEEKRAEAWASPRSVHAATDVLAASLREGMESEDSQKRTVRVIGGCVGSSWAGEFATFLTQNDIPEPRDVLTGSETVEFDRNRPDRARPILVSCANEAVRGKARDKAERAALVEAAWGLCLAGAKAGLADQVEPAAKILNDWRMTPEGGGTSQVGPKTPNELKALTEVLKQVRLTAAKK